MDKVIDFKQKKKEIAERNALSVFCGLYWRFCGREDLTIVIYPGGFEELKEERSTVEEIDSALILPIALNLLNKIERSLKKGIEFKVTKKEFHNFIKNGT